MTDLEELSDSSTSSGDENVEEDPIVVAENAGAIFVFQAALPLHVSESFLPTKGSISKEEVKQLLVQVPGTV